MRSKPKGLCSYLYVGLRRRKELKMMLRFWTKVNRQTTVALLKEMGGISLGGMWGGKVMSSIGINSYSAGELPEGH